MTERLFLGGPAHGRWIAVNGDYAHWRVPVPSSIYVIEEVRSPIDEIATYARQRYCHPSWRTLLTFYVAGDRSFRLAPGDVMPGWVVGEELPSSPVCRECRGAEAEYGDGRLCFSCWLDEAQCDHVWVDGVGNELDACARCGERE